MRFLQVACCFSASAFALAFACPSLAAQTDEFFQARVLPRDRSVALQLAPAGDVVEWRITPKGTPVPIKKGELLLTYSSFKIGFLHYNPLTAKLSASVKDFDDPAQLALQKLIDALTTTAGTLSGAKSDAKVLAVESAKATRVNLESLKNIDASIASLSLTLQSPKEKKDQAANPQQTLDDLMKQQTELAVKVALRQQMQEQLAARQTIVDSIQKSIDGDGSDKKGAEATLKEIRHDITTWPQTIQNAWGSPRTTGPAALDKGIDAMEGTVIKLTNLSSDLNTTFKESKDASFTSGTEIRLLNRLDNLIAQVDSSGKAVQNLIAVLRDDQMPARWSAPDQSVFVLGTVVYPTLATGKEVTVTVTPLTLVVTDDGLKLNEQNPVIATFNARRYRALLPEVGVGAVLGYIDRPKYGTATDTAGKTIVALSSTDHVSADPAIMINLVCHCNAGGIAPMLQVGAATSKDLPAILLGGGFRLFGLGKGDIGLGGGLLLGWYKDLQKLKVGSAVSGTAEIDADLGYISTPKPAPYITLQYKF
jgi:hypothetical protein